VIGRSFAAHLLFAKEKMSNCLLICSLQKSDWVIYRIFAHCKRAIEQFVAHSLIAKERLSNLLLICSLQKSDWGICCSFAHCKRAIACSIALSKRAKMSKKRAISQITHFLLKKKSDRSFSKWAIAQPCKEYLYKVTVEHSLQLDIIDTFPLLSLFTVLRYVNCQVCWLGWIDFLILISNTWWLLCIGLKRLYPKGFWFWSKNFASRTIQKPLVGVQNFFVKNMPRWV